MDCLISGRTPLHLAAIFQSSVAVVNLLIERGANLKKTCTKNKTPLQSAREARNEDIVRVLVWAENLYVSQSFQQPL
jgi:ankyrin repeat protein